MAAAALEAKQLEQFNALVQNMPSEVQGVLNFIKQMFAKNGYGGVHEVPDNKKTSIGDVALQESQENFKQIKDQAMKAQMDTLPPRPTSRTA